FTVFPMLPVPGAAYNYFNGISANGDVVVGYSGTNDVRHAFIWDRASNEIRTVIAEVRARGLELPVDLELIYANFLSDDGRIVVGVNLGSNPLSFWRVTLLS